MNLDNIKSNKSLVVALSALAVFLILLGFVFTASVSSPLYTLKINGLEKGVGMFYQTPVAQGEYQLTLLARRAEETKVLSQRSAVDEAILWKLVDTTRGHSDAVVALLAAEETVGISRPDALRMTHNLQVRLRTIEEVAERSEHMVIVADAIQEKRREVANIFSNRIDQFIVHATNDEVKAFLSDFLGQVLVHAEGNEMSDTLRDDTKKNLTRASESIAEGDIAKAIDTIANALQDIELERILGAEVEKPAEVKPEPEGADAMIIEVSTTTVSEIMATTTPALTN